MHFPVARSIISYQRTKRELRFLIRKGRSLLSCSRTLYVIWINNYIMLSHALLISLQHFFQKSDLLLVLAHLELASGLLFLQEVRILDHLEAVALVDQKLLSLVSIQHLMRISRDQRVEECVVLFVLLRDVSRLLRTQNTPQTLGFLSPRAEVRGDLDNHIRRRQVD